MSSTHRTRSKTATMAMLNNDPKAMVEESSVFSTDKSAVLTPVLKKRKRMLVQKKKLPVDPASEASLVNSSPPKKKKTNPSPDKDKNEEKRLRVYRKRAPQTYLEKLHRATSQRYIALPSDIMPPKAYHIPYVECS